MDAKKYLAQGIDIVSGYIKEGNLVAALNGCRELLSLYPDNSKLQKKLVDIEKKISKENEKKVDHDIEATMHLWSEGKYDELLRVYSHLHSFAPHYQKLVALTEQARSKMSAEQNAERDAFVTQAIAAIEQLRSEKKYADAYTAITELLLYEPSNQKISQLKNDIANGYVEGELERNRSIIEGNDFDRSLQLFNELLKIAPEHKTLLKFSAQARQQIAEQKILAQHIHINESIVRMKELFEKSEYEKAVQACEEILRLDPKNWTAQNYKKRSEAIIDAEMKSKLTARLIDAAQQGKEEFANNPEGFVRI